MLSLIAQTPEIVGLVGPFDSQQCTFPVQLTGHGECGRQVFVRGSAAGTQQDAASAELMESKQSLAAVVLVDGIPHVGNACVLEHGRQQGGVLAVLHMDAHADALHKVVGGACFRATPPGCCGQGC